MKAIFISILVFTTSICFSQNFKVSEFTMSEDEANSFVDEVFDSYNKTVQLSSAYAVFFNNSELENEWFLKCIVSLKTSLTLPTNTITTQENGSYEYREGEIQWSTGSKFNRKIDYEKEFFLVDSDITNDFEYISEVIILHNKPATQEEYNPLDNTFIKVLILYKK